MKDMYGRKWDSNIGRERIEPKEIPVERKETPPEWFKIVDVPEAKEKLLKHVRSENKKAKRNRVIKDVLTTGIEIMGEAIPVLKPITKRINDMTLKERLSLKLESTREGYAWIFALIAIIGGFFGYSWTQVEILAAYELIIAAVAAVLAAYYGIKDLLKKG